jgi:predicted ester cyclase
MLNEQNKALILQFYKAFDDRHIDRVLEFLTPNFIAHMPGMLEPLDKEGFKQFTIAFYLTFGQGSHVFDEVIVAENKVVTCGKLATTHVGEFQGIPPTGKEISLSVMHIDCIENGKIAEHWGQGDILGLMTQLGATFLPCNRK